MKKEKFGIDKKIEWKRRRGKRRAKRPAATQAQVNKGVAEFLKRGGKIKILGNETSKTIPDFRKDLSSEFLMDNNSQEVINKI